MMKANYLAALFSALLACASLDAQPSGGTGPLIEPEPISFLSLFSSLELDRVPTGILSEYGVHPVDFSLFDGTSVFATIANIQDIYYILQGVSASTVDNLLIQPNPSAMMNAMSNFLSSTSHVPVAVVAYKYTRFRDDAVSGGRIYYNAQNEIVEDVYEGNQWVDPYTEQYLVAFAPYLSVISRSVVFDFSPLFRYTNLSIQSIQFDPGDGVFHSVSGTTYPKYYSVASTKTLRLKITLTDNTILYARSSLLVVDEYNGTVAPSYEHFESEVESGGIYPTADVDVLFANGTENGFTKQPVIVAEGFDPFTDPYGLLHSASSSVANGKGLNDINTFVEGLNASILNSIDLVYINWNNSSASIESNADILCKVIDWVNDNNFTEYKSIIIGQSMGGLIARYALCTMESQNHNHNVAVYVSDDSPHLGANVPLGIVYAAQHLFDIIQAYPCFKCIVDGIAQNDLSIYYQELMALRDSPSVRQMLMNYVNNDYELDNDYFNSFQTTLRNTGFPQGDPGSPILNLSISNGGVNDYITSFPLVDISLQGSLGEYSQLIISTLLYFCGSALVESPIWLSLFAPSHSSLVTHIKTFPYLYSGAKVYELSVTQSTSFIWGGSPLESSFTFQSQYAPTGQLPMDNKYGSYYTLFPNSWSWGNTNWASIILSSSYQNRFMFVPTVSSLCFKKGTSNPTDVDYVTNFSSYGANMDLIPFDGYRFHRSTSSYHTSLDSLDVEWILEAKAPTIQDTVMSNGTRQFYLTGTSLYPTWSTSSSSIATIDNSGQLTVNSFGSFYVYATFGNNDSRIRLKKAITIPSLSLDGFPSYTLSSTDMTLDGVTTENVFRVRATPSAAIDSTLTPYIIYCWGRKVGSSSSITWEETTSLTHWFTIPVTDSRVVYFKVKYINQYSTTYSIACRIRPSIIILDPLGQLYTEDMGEEPFIQVKNNNEEFLVECLGEDVFFSHEPFLSEICVEMLEKQVFKDRVKLMLPWGGERQLIIPYSCTNINENETTNDVMVFIYRESVE